MKRQRQLLNRTFVEVTVGGVLWLSAVAGLIGLASCSSTDESREYRTSNTNDYQATNTIVPQRHESDLPAK